MRLAFVLLCGAALQALARVVHASDQDADALEAVLVAASEQWRADATFSADFRFRSGWALTERDAFECKSLSSPFIDATGTISKDSTRVRIQWKFDEPPLDASSNKSGSRFSRVSFDEFIGPELTATSVIGDEVLSSSTTVLKTRAGEGILNGPFSRTTYLQPLSYGDLDRGGPIVRYRKAAKPGERFQVLLKERAEDFVTLELRLISASGKFQNRFVTYWTKPQIPVLVKCRSIHPDANGDPLMTAILEASDFQTCGKVEFPKRLVSVTGPIMAPEVNGVRVSKEKGFLFQEWVATELRPTPRDRDFMIEVPPKCPIKGLKNSPPPSTTWQSLDLSKYTVADIEDASHIDVAVKRESERPFFGGWKFWALLTFFLFAIAVTVTCIMKRRRAI